MVRHIDIYNPNLKRVIISFPYVSKTECLYLLNHPKNKRQGEYTVKLKATALVFLISSFFLNSTYGCTGIRIQSKDGAFIQARTMEWDEFDLYSNVMVVPRGEQLSANTPDGKKGASWKVKYGFASMNGLNMPIATDGMNEEGLAAGAFYLPGFAEYQPYTPAEINKTMGSLDVVGYLLSNFKNIEEVRAGLPEIRVSPVFVKEIKREVPLHWLVTDASGKSIVIEYTNQGKLTVYDNPLGVITNSPTFDWHLLNIRNYANLEPNKTIAGGSVKLVPFGATPDMMGLPGDNTSPSRFVRAVIFTQTEVPLPTADRAVSEAFRILNNFDTPLGTDFSKGKLPLDVKKGNLTGVVQWITASDVKNKRYYYRTMHNSRLRMVDLKSIDFSKKGIRYVPLDHKPVQDIEVVKVK